MSCLNLQTKKKGKKVEIVVLFFEVWKINEHSVFCQKRLKCFRLQNNSFEFWSFYQMGFSRKFKTTIWEIKLVAYKFSIEMTKDRFYVKSLRKTWNLQCWAAWVLQRIWCMIWRSKFKKTNKLIQLRDFKEIDFCLCLKNKDFIEILKWIICWLRAIW